MIFFIDSPQIQTQVYHCSVPLLSFIIPRFHCNTYFGSNVVFRKIYPCFVSTSKGSKRRILLCLPSILINVLLCLNHPTMLFFLGEFFRWILEKVGVKFLPNSIHLFIGLYSPLSCANNNSLECVTHILVYNVINFYIIGCRVFVEVRILVGLAKNRVFSHQYPQPVVHLWFTKIVNNIHFTIFFYFWYF